MRRDDIAWTPCRARSAADRSSCGSSATTPPMVPRDRRSTTDPRPGRREWLDVHGTSFDIGGILSIGLDDTDPETRRLVIAEFDPYPPVRSVAEADLVLARAPGNWRPAVVDIHGLAGDGWVSASDGHSIYAVVDGRLAAIPDPFDERQARLVYERGFPIAQIFSSLIRPTVQVGLLLRDAATMHAASVEIDGSAILVAGWSESGKTETALALMERSAGFLSDKWTVLAADGRAAPFPISIGIRRWVLPYLPTLQGAMPRRSSARFLVAGAARSLITPFVRRLGRGRVAGLVGQTARQGLALADRVALTPTELRHAYGQRDDPTRRLPVRMVVLLTTVPAGRPPRLRNADREWAVERLVRTAAFERRAFVAWQERAGYAFPSHVSERTSWIDQERSLLREALSSVEIVEVAAPFPTDPGPVAEVVIDRLR
jgi:hypothetical protein